MHTFAPSAEWRFLDDPARGLAFLHIGSLEGIQSLPATCSHKWELPLRQYKLSDSRPGPLWMPKKKERKSFVSAADDMSSVCAHSCVDYTVLSVHVLVTICVQVSSHLLYSTLMPKSHSTNFMWIQICVCLCTVTKCTEMAVSTGRAMTGCDAGGGRGRERCDRQQQAHQNPQGRDWDTEPLIQVKEQRHLHNCVRYFKQTFQKQCCDGVISRFTLQYFTNTVCLVYVTSMCCTSRIHLFVKEERTRCAQ